MRYTILLSVLSPAHVVSDEFEPGNRYLTFGGGSASYRGGEGEGVLDLGVGYRMSDRTLMQRLAIEATYIESSHEDVDGLALLTRGAWRVAPQIDLNLAAGIQLSERPGGVVAIGVSQIIEQNMAVRLEYLMRERLEGFLINLVYYPWGKIDLR